MLYNVSNIRFRRCRAHTQASCFHIPAIDTFFVISLRNVQREAMKGFTTTAEVQNLLISTNCKGDREDLHHRYVTFQLVRFQIPVDSDPPKTFGLPHQELTLIRLLTPHGDIWSGKRFKCRASIICLRFPPPHSKISGSQVPLAGTFPDLVKVRL